MKLRMLLLAGTLALGACATTPKVNFDSDPAANFAAYRTYSWVYSDAPRGMNPLMYQRIKASIDRHLQGRGYTQSSTGQFAIGFTVGKRDRVEVDELGVYGPYYRGWGGWARPGYASVTEVRNVTDGTLIVDIYDAATKAPVWHGQASQDVSNRNVDQALIDTAVDAVLAKFPRRRPPERRSQQMPWPRSRKAGTGPLHCST